MKLQDRLRFRVQVAFSAIVLGFCIYKLAITDENSANSALYWGGVTSILAWWMPSPSGDEESSSSLSNNSLSNNSLSNNILSSSDRLTMTQPTMTQTETIHAESMLTAVSHSTNGAAPH